MRIPIVAFLLLATALAGCAEEPEPETLTDNVRLYRVTFEGSDVVQAGAEYGWLGVLTNYGTQATTVTMSLRDDLEGSIGSFHQDLETGQGVYTPADGSGWTLEPGDRILVGATMPFVSGLLETLAWNWATSTADGTLIRNVTDEWPITHATFPEEVGPGDQIQTTAVGFFLDGNAFYTNIADLIADDQLPVARTFFDPASADADPLAVYLYEASANEQPVRSRDHCIGTLPPGWNALAASQSVGQVSFAMLQPEEAYTQQGLEEHRLYGKPMVVLNTIVARDAGASPTDNTPDPQGSCFRASHACDQATETDCYNEGAAQTPVPVPL